MLNIKNLTVKVDDKVILKDINFEFEKGKTYAIFGPNGSGKSTLAYTIMGHPDYILSDSSQIIFEKEEITSLTSDKRANKGIFLSFQNPLALSGIKVHEILQTALQGKMNLLALRTLIYKLAKKLKLNEDLLNRSLNEGASGGERKKLEILQAAVLDRSLQIFDEVDTGVDIDALKIIGNFLKTNKKNKTYIIITHNSKAFRYLQPDKVIIIIDGKIKKVGDQKLIAEIEKNGYSRL